MARKRQAVCVAAGNERHAARAEDDMKAMRCSGSQALQLPSASASFSLLATEVGLCLLDATVSACGGLALLLDQDRRGAHQGACMAAMSQGVRPRSTEARSRRSHAYCSLSSRYGA